MEKKCVQKKNLLKKKKKESSSCCCDLELAACETPAWHYCAKEHFSAAHTWHTAPRMSLAHTVTWDEGLATPRTPRLLPFPLRNPCGRSFLATL